MHKYLKDESHYADIYDLGTIKRCLRVVDFWTNRVKDNYFKGQNAQAEAEVRELGARVELHFIQGEYFQKRESTIKEWMDHDRHLDETFHRAKEPQNIRCGDCLVQMKVISKDLWDRTDEPLKVLFLFECPKCKKRKAIFNDGKDYERKLEYCPRCKREIKLSFRKEGNNEIWEKICTNCDFIEKEVEDVKEKEVQWEAERMKDQELLRKYRNRFCFSSEEGARYGVEKGFMKEVYEDMLKTKQKESNLDYPKVIKMKSLGIVELEKLLSGILDKQKYVKLSLDKPIFDKHVIVSFTVQDADSSRKDRDSEYKLRRIIKKALEVTNWRLMSEGVSYRLGYLSGRLKGYEKEEDLLQIVKKGSKV